MIKHYTGALALLAIVTSNLPVQAQHVAAPMMRDISPPTVTAHPSALTAHHRTDPIWTDDFSDPSNWTIGALNGTNDNWVVGTAGPVGDYAIPALQSTSAANGFALFDSDVMCEVDNGYIATVSSIDLSAVTHVQLQFEQFYRRFQGHTFVDVSNDGISWIPYEVNTQLVTGQYTANPDLFTLDISQVAGSQSTVWFRFRYVGNCDYAWMVDDVALLAQPGHELSLVSASTTTWDFDTANSSDSVPYSIFPTTEIRPLAVNLTFFNAGYLPETNVMAHISTSDGYDESGSFGTVAPGDSVTWFGPLWTPTSTIGDHFIHYSVVSDDADVDTTNNADTAKIQVSDFIYARDNGIRTGEVGDESPFLVGNWMYAQTNDIAAGVMVAFSSSSDVGVEVNAQLLDGNRDPVAQTGYHTLAFTDLSPIGGSNFVTMYFDAPYQLQAGSDYLIVLQHFGGASVLVGTSGLSIPQSSLLYRGDEATWYSISTTPMVRLWVNSLEGISENDLQNGIGLGQCSPNPATSTARIEYSLQRTMDVTLELLDVSGKPVRTLAKGSTAPGTHKVDIDTRGLAAGVYYYTLRTMDAVATKRMVVVH
jgi:hypothetical protein